MYKKSIKSQLLISWKWTKHYYDNLNIYIYTKYTMKKYFFLSSLIIMLTILTACWNNENTEEEIDTIEINETVTDINEESTTLTKKIPNEEIFASDINTALQELAAQALYCETGKTITNFAILWSWKLENWDLEYYWVAESVGYVPWEWGSLQSTCYRIAPLAMEFSTDYKRYKLIDYDYVDTTNDEFLIEDYRPDMDWWALDEKVKAIFSEEAFKVWQQRDYWEHFPDYMDPDRKSFEDRAYEYFGGQTEEDDEIDNQEITEEE